MIRQIHIAITGCAAFSCFAAFGAILQGHMMPVPAQALTVAVLGLAAIVEALRAYRGEP